MNRKLLIIFVSAFILRLVLAFVVWHPDVNNHIDWGIRFWQYGPARFYAPETNVWSYTWPNQPPGTIYIFAGIRKLYEFLFSVLSIAHFQFRIFPGSWLLFLESNLYPALLKLPAIFADLGIACLIYRLLMGMKKEKLGIAGAALYLFNPVIWYNSAVWGQTDAIINFFALLAFYFLIKKKLAPAFLFLILSLYIKASLIIFLPIFAIIAFCQRYKLSEYLLAVVISLIPIALFTLPFSVGEPFGWLLNLYTGKVFTEQLHLITANAFNLWAAVAGIHERPQSLLLGPLTYQTWGTVLFAISYIPALYLVWKRQDTKTVIWALAIASFSSFMLMTNMHERYLYPLFPYLTILVALDTKLVLIYLSISLINLLNLYNFWWVPKIDMVVKFLSFSDRLMPRILGGISFILFLLFYIRGLRENHLRQRLS